LGVPTILSDIPVHRELTRSGFCQPIRHQGLKSAVHEFYIDQAHRFARIGQWYDFHPGDIRTAILEVFQHYPDFLNRAAEGSRWIENKWTNANSISQLIRQVRSIA